MIPIVNKKYKYILYYNPKSACSFYRNLFVDLHSDELKQQLGFQPTKKHLAKHLKPAKYKLYYDYYKFSIVRNPYDRVISGYLNKCVEVSRLTSERFIVEHFKNTIHRPIFEFLERDIDYKSGYTFIELITYLKENINRGNVNPHFDRQHNKNIKLNSFYRIEDDENKLVEIYNQIFKKDLSKIQQLKTILKRASHSDLVKNETRKKNKPTLKGIELYNKTFDELYELGQDYNFTYNDFLKQSIKVDIENIYRIDFEKYKYDKNSY